MRVKTGGVRKTPSYSFATTQGNDALVSKKTEHDPRAEANGTQYQPIRTFVFTLFSLPLCIILNTVMPLHVRARYRILIMPRHTQALAKEDVSSWPSSVGTEDDRLTTRERANQSGEPVPPLVQNCP